jgi:Family of unknown function (DUF6653)
MAILSDKTWARHANPWSGWSRVALMPMLSASLYFRNWWLLAVTILWAIVNPVAFPPPKHAGNWMSRGVIGEQLYFAGGRKLKRDLPTFLNLVNIPVFVAFLAFSWRQEIWHLILSGLLTLTIKFWFIDRMVALTDANARSHEVSRDSAD